MFSDAYSLSADNVGRPCVLPSLMDSRPSRSRGRRYGNGWFRMGARRRVMVLLRWPVWASVPTVRLRRYTGSIRWDSSAPCRPSTLHLPHKQKMDTRSELEMSPGFCSANVPDC